MILSPAVRPWGPLVDTLGTALLGLWLLVIPATTAGAAWEPLQSVGLSRIPLGCILLFAAGLLAFATGNLREVGTVLAVVVLGAVTIGFGIFAARNGGQGLFGTTLGAILVLHLASALRVR